MQEALEVSFRMSWRAGAGWGGSGVDKASGRELEGQAVSRT